MASQTETPAGGEFIFRERGGTASRESIVIAASAGLIPSGRMLGARTVASTSAAKAGGNTGNGTMGAITTAPDTRAGVYQLRITTAQLNAGIFTVTNSAGTVVGAGTVAVAFNQSGLAFTLADGITDFIVGDGFDITVPATLYDNYDDGAADGTQVARGILYAEVDATAAVNVPAISVHRDIEVVSARVTSEIAGHKAAGIIDLVARGFLFR